MKTEISAAYINKRLFILILLVVSSIQLQAQNNQQDSARISFEQQNKGKKFKSISFGLGTVYGTNKNLIEYIKTVVPNYSSVPVSQQIPEASAGFEFFAGYEKQISHSFSLKGEYSFFIKSINIPYISNYNYSYSSHQLTAYLNYLIPQEYSFIKLSGGAGYLLSSFERDEPGFKEDYKSNGVIFRLAGTFNAQLSKKTAGYISGFLSGTFNNTLKDKSGNEVKMQNGDPVNLNSLGAGLRLGLEVYFF